jgi:hypothetical protein
MKILAAGRKTIFHLMRDNGSPAAVCGPQSEFGDREDIEDHRGCTPGMTTEQPGTSARFRMPYMPGCTAANFRR